MNEAPLHLADADSAEQSVASHASGWLSASVARLKLIAELALAEAKLAASSVALMAFLGTGAAICVLSAWGLVVAGGILALLNAGIPLWAMLMTFALLHLLIAAFAVRKIVALSDLVGFTATRQQLRRNSEGT